MERPTVLVIGAVLALGAALLARRRAAAAGHPAERRRWALLGGATALFVLLLFIALSGPGVRAGSAVRHVVLLRDVSESVRDDRLEDALRWARNPPDGLRVAVIDFAAFPSPPSTGDGTSASFDPPWRESTDLAAALDAARRYLAPLGGGDVLLCSDGRSDSAVSGAVRRLSGVAVLTALPLRTLDADPAVLERLIAPARARENQPVQLEAVLRVAPGTTGEVLFTGPGIEARRSFSSPEGGVQRVTMSLTPPPGVARFTAQLSTVQHDPEPRNNRAHAFMRVVSAARTLVVSGLGIPVPAEILGEPEDQQRISADDPDWTRHAQGADLLVLDNVPATRLPPTAAGMLAREVRERGLSLVVLGGGAALGPGGYSETEFERELMPLLSDPGRRRLDLAVLLDNSGSMAGRKWKDVARAAAALIAGRGRRDRLRVSGFRARPILLAEGRFLGVEENELLAEGLARLGTQPSGGTDIAAAVGDAVAALEGSTADVRHILLLTDGADHDPATLPRRLAPLGARMRRADISITTVTTAGRGALFKPLGGRVVDNVDTSRLVDVFLGDLQGTREYIAKGRLSVRGSPGFEIPEGTVLSRLVRTRAAPSGRVLADTDEGPVVAVRRVGLGRVWALAFRPGIREWSAEFSAGPKAMRALKNLLDDARTPPSIRGLRLALLRRGARFRARLTRESAKAALPERVRLRAGEKETTLFRNGVHQWEGPAPEIDDESPASFAILDETGSALAVLDARTPRSIELLPGNANRELLRRIAGETGGRVIHRLASFAPLSTVRKREATDLSALFFVLALAVLVVEVGLGLGSRNS